MEMAAFRFDGGSLGETSGPCGRRVFLKQLGALATALGGAASWLTPGCARTAAPGTADATAAGRRGARPNIILITIDDMGWADLGCFGSQYYETPHIDRLCAQGMKFNAAYAACAVCSPTRAAIQTGRYPARIGITDWIRPNIPVEDGKNPTGFARDKEGLFCPRNHQFLGHDEVTIAEVLKPLGYATGHIGKWHLGDRPWYPDTQGYDVNIGGAELGHQPSYFDPYTDGDHPDGIPNLPARRRGEYLTDRLGDEADRFVRAHKDGPFFLNWCPYAVHVPNQGKPELVAKYEAKPRGNQKSPVYAAMIESVDESVGRIMATLDELGLADNTIVIFTSDNGGFKGSTNNSPLREAKAYPYEGGIRVPQIVRWPGVVAPGSVCETPVISMDFLPTIAAAAGAPLPTGRVIDGVSLLPLLTGSGALGRDTLYWHYPHFCYTDIVPYSIIRRGPWKLIKRYVGREFELYNLDDDLSEARDLSAEMPDRVRELDAGLSAWLRETGAKLPRRKGESATG
ncbi:MAG: sulfatase [bacterium]|nr:sulfatase [bacterium]